MAGSPADRRLPGGRSEHQAALDARRRGDPNEMVDNWHELGFIVDPGNGLAVEIEKTNVCKSCFFINNRPEISQDEANALIDSHDHINDGLFVIVQGLAPSDLGITTASPTQAQLNTWAPQITNPVPGTMMITPADMKLEDNNLSQTQRITFGYDIAFTSTNAFTQEDVPETIGASVLGLSTATIIDLTTRQHPYMVAGPTTWLSADTRVFKLQPNEMFAAQTMGTDPNKFIADVIHSLRSSPAQANAWFDALPPDEQGAQLEWSEQLNNQPVYNFAICRVRYRAELNDAPNVRVFFRLFPAMTTSTRQRFSPPGGDDACARRPPSLGEDAGAAGASRRQESTVMEPFCIRKAYGTCASIKPC